MELEFDTPSTPTAKPVSQAMAEIDVPVAAPAPAPKVEQSKPVRTMPKISKRAALLGGAAILLIAAAAKFVADKPDMPADVGVSAVVNSAAVPHLRPLEEDMRAPTIARERVAPAPSVQKPVDEHGRPEALSSAIHEADRQNIWNQPRAAAPAPVQMPQAKQLPKNDLTIAAQKMARERKEKGLPANMDAATLQALEALK